MAISMTGLGVGEIKCGNKTIVVELRSVNNRFLDVSCRMPSSLSQYENVVRDVIRKKIQRGKLYVTISIQGDNNGILELRVNSQTAKAVRSLLENLKEEAGIIDEIKLDHFIKFSEVFEPFGEPKIVEEIWEEVHAALGKAITELQKMRKKEGGTLTKDILQRIDHLDINIRDIEEIAKKNLPEAYKKMVYCAQNLITDCEVQKDRLYAELAILASKIDVTEECVRMKSHDQLFRETVTQDKPVGKKLNFILQEMNREVNTISAKASNAEISHIVVEMKEEIEKLREQVQNLE